MKKIIYLALVALICSCSGGKNYTIEVSYAGMKAGDSVKLITLMSSDEDAPLAVAAVDEEGKCTLSGKAEESSVALILVNGQRNVSVVMLESGAISVVEQGRGDVALSGTPLNELYSDYLAQSKILFGKYSELSPETMSQEELNAARDEISQSYADLISSTVDANVDNLFGAFVFATGEINEIETSKAAERMAQFSAETLELDFMQEAAATIEAKLRIEVGQPYTDIKLFNAEGVEIAVSDLLSQGKYVLIDFWATWCGPCMAEMPHLKEAYAKYKNKGFEIYGVSFDRKREDWIRVSAEHPWIHVLRTEESSVGTDYAVRTIPSNFLISPDGIIVAAQLRGEAVVEKLSELLK